ncbi:MAG TPA: hypothetical protein DCF33_08595 [Saprospirales bacterium]|nr:hypothetical protein [Saprospirales bacterium]
MKRIKSIVVFLMAFWGAANIGHTQPGAVDWIYDFYSGAGFSGLANGIAVQGTENAIFSSSTQSSTWPWGPGFRMTMGKLTTYGNLDPGFAGGSGYMVPPLWGPNNVYEPVVAVQPDQKIVCGAWAVLGGLGDFVMVRIAPDGGPDPGWIPIPVDVQLYDVAEGLAVLPDGTIIQVGFSYTQWPWTGLTLISAVKRLKDGQLDLSFNGTGIMKYTFPGHSRWIGNAVVAQPDGKMVIAGYNSDSTDTYFSMLVMRILPNGELDPTFNPPLGYKLIPSFPGYNNLAAYAMALEKDGRIVLAGQANKIGFDNEGVVVRLMPDGSNDPTFGTGGIAPFTCGSKETVKGLVIDKAGHYILAGRSSDDWMVACMDKSGVLVPGFGTGGCVSMVGNQLHAVTVDSLNRILASGDESSTEIKVVRLKNFPPVNTYSPYLTTIPLRLYPNPVDESVTVEYTAALAGKAIFRLVDAMGRQVLEYTDSDQIAGPRQTELLLGKYLPPGVYGLTVQTGQEIGFARLVKM